MPSWAPGKRKGPVGRTWCEPFIEKKGLSWRYGWNKNGLKKQDMDNLIVDRYMRLIEPLPFETKLELISKLFENLKTKVSIPTMNKDELINELYGSWHDVNESLIDDIYSH